MRYKFMTFLLVIIVITLGCVDKSGIPKDNSDQEKISIKDTPVTGSIETGTDIKNETSSDLETPTQTDMSSEENGSIEIYGNETNDSQQNISEEFLLYTFGINDSKNMLDREVKLVDLVESNTTAIVMVDGETFKLLYDVDQEIKERVIIVTDVDNTTRTAAIAVGYLDSD